jgi:hypothetical protein
MHHPTRSGPLPAAPRACRRWRAAALALLGLVLGARPAAAQQGEISGVVVEQTSQRPVAGATVGFSFLCSSVLQCS